MSGGAKFLYDGPARNFVNFKNERIGEAGSDVGALVAALSLPSEFPAPRFNGDASCIPTAVKALTQDVKINWETSVSAGAVPAAEAWCFVFRNALRSFIFYDHNPAGTNYNYELISSFDGTTTFNVAVNASAQQLYAKWATPSTAYHPHGDILFPGYAQGKYGWWCDNDGQGNTTAMKITYTADPGADGAEFQFMNWNGFQWEPQETIKTAAGVLTYQPAGPYNGGGYVALDVLIKNAAASVFKVAITKTGATCPGVWCHRPIASITELLPIIQGIRINAGSILWSNTSAELYESGKIVSVNVSRSLPWTNIAVDQDNLTLLQGYESRLAKTGYYGFLKPDGPKDFKLRNDVTTLAPRGATATAAYFPLVERSTYLAVAWNVSTTTARDTTAQICHTVEYLTNSKIQEVDYSHFTEQQWIDAIQELRTIPQHHENKFHFKNILRGIGKVGKFLFKGAQIVSKAVPLPMFQAVGQGLDMAESLGANQLFDAMSNYGKKRRADQ
jgi:hypothetical protein